MAVDNGLVDPKAEQEKARDLATVQPQLLVADMIRAVGTVDEGRLQRWVVRVPIFAKHQYLIPGRSIPGKDLPLDLQSGQAQRGPGLGSRVQCRPPS